jgi:NarL family two-component system response regulator LiaR
MRQPEQNSIRILIVDDHEVVRRGLSGFIEARSGFELVGEAANGIEAVAKALLLKPDVIIMDLVMPRMDGVEAISEIKKQNPDARILVLTSFSGDDKIFPALKVGAQGYLLKDSSPEELMQAVLAVYRGESYLQSFVASRLVSELSRKKQVEPVAMDVLTRREREVLALLAQGMTNREISQALSVSEKTARFHVSNILEKLALNSRTQAALYAHRKGLDSQ